MEWKITAAFSYVYFRGETYYLQDKLTEKGNTSYYFSEKTEEVTRVDQIPNGYEGQLATNRLAEIWS